MALQNWYVDLRPISDEAEYLRIFDLLDRKITGFGLNPTAKRRYLPVFSTQKKTRHFFMDWINI